jgi:hypothetical protein
MTEEHVPPVVGDARVHQSDAKTDDVEPLDARRRAVHHPPLEGPELLHLQALPGLCETWLGGTL